MPGEGGGVCFRFFFFVRLLLSCDEIKFTVAASS